MHIAKNNFNSLFQSALSSYRLLFRYPGKVNRRSADANVTFLASNLLQHFSLQDSPEHERYITTPATTLVAWLPILPQEHCVYIILRNSLWLCGVSLRSYCECNSCHHITQPSHQIPREPMHEALPQGQ